MEVDAFVILECTALPFWWCHHMTQLKSYNYTWHKDEIVSFWNWAYSVLDSRHHHSKLFLTLEWKRLLCLLQNPISGYNLASVFTSIISFVHFKSSPLYVAFLSLLFFLLLSLCWCLAPADPLLFMQTKQIPSKQGIWNAAETRIRQE